VLWGNVVKQSTAWTPSFVIVCSCCQEVVVAEHNSGQPLTGYRIIYLMCVTYTPLFLKRRGDIVSLRKINVINTYLSGTHICKHIKINHLTLDFTECNSAWHCVCDNKRVIALYEGMRALTYWVHAIKVCAHLLCVVCSYSAVYIYICKGKGIKENSETLVDASKRRVVWK
jgi:hypothetical protein